MHGPNDNTLPKGTVASFVNQLPPQFKIKAVDGITSAKPDIAADLNKDPEIPVFSNAGLVSAAIAVPGKLNVLAKLTGKFKGAGLNTIFRPSFGNNRRNNVLEYNLTEEHLEFKPDIGDVPNRGLGKQRDVIVKGVPYTQQVWDYYNPKTGHADSTTPVPIHYENGIFIRTPPTDVRPQVDHGTISRLGSIPHGTVINCQGFEPNLENPTSGSPVFQPVSLLPFPVGTPSDHETFADYFPQLNLKKPHNLRIPEKIKEGGTLNETLMLDPNQFLQAFNENSSSKRIKDHIHFKVHSDPKVSEIPGGGTANTAFLAGSGIRDGRQNPGPNAHGVSVGCHYWISTVEYDVLLPEGDYTGGQKVTVPSRAREEEIANKKRAISPVFEITLNRQVPPNTIVKLEATQIQYSQNVTLDFDEMGWPHISVATLSPFDPVPVAADKVIF